LRSRSQSKAYALQLNLYAGRARPEESSVFFAPANLSWRAWRYLLVPDREIRAMNLYTWLPGLFVLGLASLAVCLAFVYGCERI
jgi:hypothetical protein